MVRLLGGGGGRKEGRQLDDGSNVEGADRGKGDWCPGRISRVNRDGTFDIEYDDGEKETKVEESMVRLIGGGGGKKDTRQLDEGSKVEGNYRGKGRWYPGRISRVNRDGTYDIDYDDGVKET